MRVICEQVSAARNGYLTMVYLGHSKGYSTADTR